MYLLLLFILVILTICESFSSIRTYISSVRNVAESLSIEVPLQRTISTKLYETSSDFDLSDTESLIINSNDNQNQEEWYILANKFEDAWLSVFKGDQSKMNILLSKSKSKEITWNNPLISNFHELKEGWDNFAQFFQDPVLTIYNKSKNDKGKIILDFQLSFWYPIFWRPRIIIPGIVIIECNSDYTSIIDVKEEWKVSISDIILKQLPPRFWDVWHLYSSPPSEYVPEEKIIGRENGVTFIQLPQQIVCDISWSNKAEYPGPPITTIPSFSLFGKFRTSLPNRDPTFATQPIEVSSAKYIAKDGEAWKQTTWSFTVPSCVHPEIIQVASNEEIFPCQMDAVEEEENEDVNDVADYETGVDSVGVMKSVTGGAARGQFQYDKNEISNFKKNEIREYRYRIQPPRVVAMTEFKGEATPTKISDSLKSIRTTIGSAGINSSSRVRRSYPWGSLSTKLSPSPSTDIDIDIDTESNDKISCEAIGLRLTNVKSCFNAKGEPSMAVYVMQYNDEKTQVFLEVDR